LSSPSTTTLSSRTGRLVIEVNQGELLAEWGIIQPRYDELDLVHLFAVPGSCPTTAGFKKCLEFKSVYLRCWSLDEIDQRRLVF